MKFRVCSLCMGYQARVRDNAVVFSNSRRNFDIEWVKVLKLSRSERCGGIRQGILTSGVRKFRQTGKEEVILSGIVGLPNWLQIWGKIGLKKEGRWSY